MKNGLMTLVIILLFWVSFTVVAGGIAVGFTKISGTYIGDGWAAFIVIFSIIGFLIGCKVQKEM